MDYSSLEAMTGACHAPVAGRQGKAMADMRLGASSVPVEKSADFEAERQGDFQKISLPVGGKYEQKCTANRLLSTPDFEAVGITRKPKKTERLPQNPHIPSESPRYFAAAG